MRYPFISVIENSRKNWNDEIIIIIAPLPLPPVVPRQNFPVQFISKQRYFLESESVLSLNDICIIVWWDIIPIIRNE